jgi:hypothetical protein
MRQLQQPRGNWMTLDELKPFEARMSERAYVVATMLVEGATLLGVRDQLHIGARTFERLCTEAETAVGQRLRRRWHDGGQGRPGPRVYSRAPEMERPEDIKVQPGDRCPVCTLSEPHECMRAEDYMRSGERAGSVRYGRMLHEE